jgi:GTPase
MNNKDFTIARAGFIGLIGQANSGKSTLLNALVETRVSIVNPKPQTTRRRVVGILNDQAAQFVFVDAPGMVRAEKGLNYFLQEELLDVIKNSDVLVAVLSIDEKEFAHLEEIVKLVKSSGRPWIAVINKTDMEALAHRIMRVKTYVEQQGARAYTLSALAPGQESLQEIKEALRELLPPAEHPLFDPEIYTTQNMREISAEIIRERGFAHLHHELPYAMAVRIRAFDESRPDLIKIFAEILVEKENYRPMVIGKGGEMIKKIGQEARKEIEKVVGNRVYLDLQVRVRENWSQNRGLMKELGYVVSDHP